MCWRSLAGPVCLSELPARSLQRSVHLCQYLFGVPRRLETKKSRHERLRASIRLSPGQGEKRMPTQAEIRIAFWTRQLVHCESIVAKQDIIVVMLENLGQPNHR